MRANIVKLYLINFLTGLVFWYAVEKLFMYSIGINAFGVSINAVVLVVISSLFDVPFGVLADRWSRKYTLALGILYLLIWLVWQRKIKLVPIEATIPAKQVELT